MKVLKRNGSYQDFDLDKIRLSVERASDEANEPFNTSDLELLGKDIEHAILNCCSDVIHADDIKNIVAMTLMKLGFKKVALYYNEHKKD